MKTQNKSNNQFIKKLIKIRPYIQLTFGIIVYALLFYFNIGLGIVFGAAIVLGAVFGKFFCNWMCPIGFIKYLMTRNMSDDQKQLQKFNYYKMGCPISWVQGLLNKISLFKIRKDSHTCISCGKCDTACYVSTFSEESNLYKEDFKPSSEAFNCSKCLECVAVCPNGSLSYKIK